MKWLMAVNRQRRAVVLLLVGLRLAVVLAALLLGAVGILGEDRVCRVAVRALSDW